MKARLFVVISFCLILTAACSGDRQEYLFEVSNSLDSGRQGETVSILKSVFGDMLCQEFERLVVLDRKTGEYLPSQVMDTDMDGELDILVFQPSLEAGESRKYRLVLQEEPVDYSGMEFRTFSRFVPERIDDYTWENDRVAFRTYGPVAQEMMENGTPGGTLSSGIDCWLKKVAYPIIDNWYHNHLVEGKSYHMDHGEGLDDFHVGPSRGCGSTGVWDPATETLYTSKNFTAWRTVSEGPLRTQFELDYAPWDYPGGAIAERKIISLDLGSNLMRIELRFGTGNVPDVISAGLTLHEKDGNIRVDEEAGWFSYWQPHGESELGMGIVVDHIYLQGHTEHISDEKDKSHLLVHMKPVDGKLVYFTGFGWKNSGQYNSEDEWIGYLGDFSLKLAAEMKAKLK